MVKMNDLNAKAKYIKKMGFFNYALLGLIPNLSVLKNMSQIKKIIVFQVTGRKILGRVGTQFFLIISFWKKYILMHLERENAF